MSENAVALRNMSKLKELISNKSVKNKFNDLLPGRAEKFTSNILNVVHNSSSLVNCDPMSIITSAMIAASLDLPIDSNFGYCALTPYKGKCQFQIMTKGFVQLCLKTELYKTMHVTDVYEDELEEYDELEGTFIPKEYSSRTQRRNNETNKIIGYKANFELKSGFKKTFFMYSDQILAHGKKYSPSFNYSTSLWKKDIPSMSKKTVLKLLLKSWGILTGHLSDAMKYDQGTPQDLDNLDNVDYGEFDIQVTNGKVSPLELGDKSDETN